MRFRFKNGLDIRILRWILIPEQVRIDEVQNIDAAMHLHKVNDTFRANLLSRINNELFPEEADRLYLLKVLASSPELALTIAKDHLNREQLLKENNLADLKQTLLQFDDPRVREAVEAWNLKSRYGLLMPNRQRGLELVQMEFRRFLHAIVLLPSQILRSGRRIICYNRYLKDFCLRTELVNSNFANTDDQRSRALLLIKHSAEAEPALARSRHFLGTVHVSGYLAENY